MRHSTRVQAALARLPEVDPAIAALALWCSYRDGAGPTVTEGETIYLGSAFPLLPLSEQVGIIAHHVMHVALRHSARRSDAGLRYGATFLPDLFDLACDALVNEALLQGGHALPRPAVRAADIAAMLPPDARPDNVLAEWDCLRLYTEMAVISPRPGGGAEGDIAQYAKAQGFTPDLKGSDPDKAEAAVWSGRVEQALREGQRAGSGIGAVLDRFGDLPKAVVPWEIKLRRLLNKALLHQPRQSYRRPSRSWLARDSLARRAGGAQPAFEPGVVWDQRRPRLVVGLDTSSSIAVPMLEMFAAEAMSIVRRTGAEAHLLGFDTEVHARQALARPDALAALSMRRGGGTDLAPMLSEADGLTPSIIIVLTDLDAPTPVTPSAPVLWAVPAAPTVTPGFGEVLVMADT